jgi:hypothetical protein
LGVLEHVGIAAAHDHDRLWTAAGSAVACVRRTPPPAPPPAPAGADWVVLVIEPRLATPPLPPPQPATTTASAPATTAAPIALLTTLVVALDRQQQPNNGYVIRCTAGHLTYDDHSQSEIGDGPSSDVNPWAVALPSEEGLLNI